jgi:hypothetical protein
MKLPCSLIIYQIKKKFNINAEGDIKEDFLVQRPKVYKDGESLLKDRKSVV